jgi:Amt family ammonium transporter
VLGSALVVTAIIALILRAIMGLRVTEEQEIGGIDLAEHAESAYEIGEAGGGGVFAGVGHAARHNSEEE